MATNVIHRGTPPSERVYVQTCRECTTVFTYQKVDVKHDQRDGSSIKCPVCGAFLLPADKLYEPGPPPIKYDEGGSYRD